MRVTLLDGVSLSLETSDTLPRAEVDHLVLDLAPQLAARLRGAVGALVATSHAKEKAVEEREAPSPVILARSEESPASPASPLEPPVLQPSAVVRSPKPSRAPSTTSPAPRAWDGPVPETVLAFCRANDPKAAMRRIVALTEAAFRASAQPGLSTADLAAGFTAMGWEAPADFSAAVRNAARASFGWLVRVPGAEGVYGVTNKGRHEVLHGL